MIWPLLHISLKQTIQKRRICFDLFLVYLWFVLDLWCGQPELLKKHNKAERFRTRALSALSFLSIKNCVCVWRSRGSSHSFQNKSNGKKKCQAPNVETPYGLCVCVWWSIVCPDFLLLMNVSPSPYTNTKTRCFCAVSLNKTCYSFKLKVVQFVWVWKYLDDG